VGGEGGGDGTGRPPEPPKPPEPPEMPEEEEPAPGSDDLKLWILLIGEAIKQDRKRIIREYFKSYDHKEMYALDSSLEAFLNQAKGDLSGYLEKMRQNQELLDEERIRFGEIRREYMDKIGEWEIKLADRESEQHIERPSLYGPIYDKYMKRFQQLVHQEKVEGKEQENKLQLLKRLTAEDEDGKRELGRLRALHERQLRINIIR